MKYKALVTGKNTAIIDEFFVQMDENFEVVSTSTRFNDIMRHIKYFTPDLFVYCLSNEARESITQMALVKDSLLRSRIPVIIIGEKEECDEFERTAVNVSNMVLTRPITAASIQERIVQFMDERQPYKAAYIEKQEQEEEKKSLGNEPVSKEKLEEAFQSLAAELSLEEDPAPRYHVLIVDDSPLMLKTLKEYLHEDYDVATAVSGRVALKFLERKKTDLILLDYEMPEENGPAVLEKLRANEETKDIPVIFLTGVSDRKKIQEALALRPQSYLLKPVEREKLIEAIAKVFG